MKLNIGCENCVLPTERWINYDRVSQREDVVQCDIRCGIPHKAESVEEIYGGNFFDHLTYVEGVELLVECYRVLIPGGIVRFSVMDTDKIINKYLSHSMSDYNELQPNFYRNMNESTKFAVFLLGNLANEKEYTGHKMVYTPESLMAVFKAARFSSVKIVTPNFTQEPWCVENPEYQKHNLYVEAVK